MATSNKKKEKDKSLESWIWDAACSFRGAQDAPKYKEFILPLIFVKRLCDVFDDEIDCIVEKVKSRNKALQLIKRDKSLVRFYLPIFSSGPLSLITNPAILIITGPFYFTSLAFN
jgi:type I restriction enzyme M protein